MTVQKLKRLVQENEIFWVTTRTYGHQALFAQPPLADIVISAIAFLVEKGQADVLSYVLMPDHLHLLVIPRKGWTLCQLMHSLKSYSANVINKRRGLHGHVWQGGYFEHIVRNEKDLAEKVAYVVANPVKAGLSDKPSSYPYLWVDPEVLLDCGVVVE